MTNYPEELKQKVINDMSPPNSLKIPDLVTKYNVPKQTLYYWRKKALQQGKLVTGTTDCNKWSNEAKLASIIETSVMTQAEKGEYCRQKGIYLEQLEQWKTACLSGFNTVPALNSKQKNEQNKKDNEIKRLEKELNRKDKALAEAAALMVLSKKYRHHFQDEES
ncbi:transposase [Psychromonas antarctica]|uniref:transposase n=1 Tax=Psychromonas antarctica TaxID=67573 RepID=UPI001EE8212E|nr:transposase [Psychromonas antarctica]MCG6202931.1 transposase [Psychromonas antarctica]